MLRILDYLRLMAVQTTAITILVWVHVEQGFGWLDFVFAMSAAAGFALMIPVLRSKLGWTVPIPLPGGFWPTLLILLPLALAVSAIPLAAIYVLHPEEFRSRTVIELLTLSMWLAVSFSYTFSRRGGSETPPLDNPRNSSPKA